MTRGTSGSSHGEILLRERFEHMAAEFKSWRMSDFIRQLEASKGKGRVLPFIRGLRLSAQLVYAIRELLIGSGLTATWGHLLDEKWKFCSPECDVIIYKERGQLRQWNGTREPVMDFRFVLMTEAVVVISCKSKIRSTDLDEKYSREIKKYVDRVWLFAECCGPRSPNRVMEKALQAGYEHFWYLYTWAPKREEIFDRDFNREGWNDFIKEVQKLKD